MNYKRCIMLCIIIFILFATVSVSFANENNNFDENITKEKENIAIEEDIADNYIEEENSNIKNEENKILSQCNNDIKASRSEIKITVKNYTALISYQNPKFYITTLTANVTYSNDWPVNRGSVRFVIDQKGRNINFYSSDVKNGIASYNGNKEVSMSPGSYRCTAFYQYYVANTKTLETCSCDFYLIVKSKTSLSAKSISCKKNDTVEVKYNLTSFGGMGRGSLIYTIGSETYNTTKSLKLQMNKSGLYKCTVKYVGDSYHLNSTTSTFYINVADDTRIEYVLDSSNILSGSKFNISYKVLDSQSNIVKKGKVKVTKSTTSNNNKIPVHSTYGDLLVEVPDLPGKYEYKILYEGMDKQNFNTRNYQNKKSFFYINVYAKSSIIANPLERNIGEKTNIVLKVKDHLGQNINEGSLKVKILGKTYVANVKNGKAIFKNVKMPSKAKKYRFKVSYYSKTGFYTNSSTMLEISCKYCSKVTVKSITGYEGKKVKLTALVQDTAGNKIKKGTVKFKIHSKTYKASVKNGKATVTIKMPFAHFYKAVTKTSGKKCIVTRYFKTVYKCKVTFSGYKQYPGSSSEFTVTSKSEPFSYITYKDSENQPPSSSSSDQSSSSKNSIILKNDYYTFWFNYQGDTLGNMPVTYRIYSGSSYDEYDSQTDSLGYVTIYDIPKGEHKIYIEGHYLLSTKTYKSTFTVYR